MLPPKENELITRVGQGTPMGDTMRRYWIPACLASEIAEPDSPPVRVRLLGEDLVAFRDSEGRIGLIDELCPHRRVSLFFGRNEECGLRCVYHGWKYDVEGNCVDQLNEPEEHQFKHHIHITAYPTVELGGLQAIEPVCPRQGAQPRRRRHRLRLSLCRHPAARRFGRAHPHLSFRHAIPSDPAVALGIGAADGRRPHLGPDG